MKLKFPTSILLFIIFSISLQAQEYFGEEIKQNDNLSNIKINVLQCINEQQYELIEKRCNENINHLRISGGQVIDNLNSTTTLDWPLKPAQGLNDCSYYHIAAYVDQDTITGSFHDFNCGTNTYDGHRGTDIATWPFNFYKMDNDLVEVVAAAPGVILDKHDGEFDRNCSSNNLTANYVVIQHGDGSRALYWHMKNGSITSNAIGASVAAGDHLGVVGSSGSASGPHLHFEVWNGSTAAARIDPYSGSCNTLNASSWWASQNPYKETSIIKATTHTTDIVLPPCPATETLNESHIFQIPFQGAGLPAGYAKFYIFIRDEVSGLSADCKILNPNGSTYLSWTYNSTSDNKVKTWGWSKALPVTPGMYTFQAVYNGITCSSDFEITTGTDILNPESSNEINVYPNPTNGKFILKLENNKAQEFYIYNLLGDKVFQSKINADQSEININLQNGMYFFRVKDASEYISSGRLLIQNSK